MSEHNTADLTAQASKDFQASRGALAWLIVHLEEDGSYSTHKVPIAQSASLMTTAVQKKWRALTSTKSRVGNRLLLRKVVVEIVDIVPVYAPTVPSVLQLTKLRFVLHQLIPHHTDIFPI